MSDVKWTEVPIEKDEVTWTEVDDSSIEGADKKPWYDISAKGLTRGAIDAIPVVAAAGGGILGTALGPAGSVGGAGLGYAGGKELQDILKNRLLGDEAASVDPVDQVKRVAGNLMDGASMEMGGQVLGATLKAGASAKDKAAAYLREKAEKAAVNATGATGVQASKFEKDAGRQLLDRKLVRFGDTPEKIAERTRGAMDQAGADIDGALKGLDAKGVVANQDNIVAKLSQKIADLKKDPSQAGTVRKLETVVDDIMNTGRSNLPVSEAEKIKRGFNKAAGNWMDPEAGAAGKEAYLGYMDEVERAAGADPTLKSMLKEGKETYGLLAPIEEAASRRAMTTGQSPAGGFLDVTSILGGAATGGAPLAVAAPIARRIAAPRIASSAAVASDKVANFLMKQPKFSALAKTNPNAFTALAGDFSRRVGSESSKVANFNPQDPVDDDKAKQSFLEGN